MSLEKNALEFSQEQILETEKDMQALHVTEADIKTKASEYIPQIIKFVENLIEKGDAYATEKGDVYYSVKTFKEYGKLSHRKVDELRNGVRIEVEEGQKRSRRFLHYGNQQNPEKYIGNHLGVKEDQAGI